MQELHHIVKECNKNFERQSDIWFSFQCVCASIYSTIKLKNLLTRGKSLELVKSHYKFHYI